MNLQLGARRFYRTVLLSVILFSSGSLATAQTRIFEEPLSPRIANYDIKVTLDDEAKRIDGDMVLTWNNPSDDHVDELQFHLYTNAFKNAKSTWIREWLRARAASSDSSEPGESPWDKDNEDVWGWIRITRMEVDGDDVTGRIAFFQPDDDNADDETVIRVPLTNPIAPRESARIQLAFQGRIPKCKVRTGWWQDDFFMMVHWFPKIGVYEPPGMRFVPADAPHGRWNCHQFHAGTEFYADFGVYDVQITLPEKYVVGTTGLIIEERSNGDGTKTIVAHAEDVHKFAWVADAQFLEATDVWQSPADGHQVDIRLLYQPGHQNVVDKYIESTKSTLEHVDGWLGPGAYPYPNITVVDPRAASGAGGMEYPTLITGGAVWWAEQL
ncbi:MAG: M1 family peptidase, partial [Phycisphaerae bacterium]